MQRRANGGVVAEMIVPLLLFRMGGGRHVVCW